MWMYCDPDNHELKSALAEHLGVSIDNVVVGEGIDGLLNLVVRMFVSPGAPVVTSLGAYPTFNFHVEGFGGRLVAVPFEHDRESLEGLLAAVRQHEAPLVYLSNPDNPMGTWWQAADITRFVDDLPERTLLVLDEAYGETAPQGTLPPLDTDAPERRAHAHLLQGLRPGRHSLRLCRWRGDADPRRREGAQSLRRQPHGADRRRRRACRPVLFG